MNIVQCFRSFQFMIKPACKTLYEAHAESTFMQTTKF